MKKAILLIVLLCTCFGYAQKYKVLSNKEYDLMMPSSPFSDLRILKNEAGVLKSTILKKGKYQLIDKNKEFQFTVDKNSRINGRLREIKKEGVLDVVFKKSRVKKLSGKTKHYIIKVVVRPKDSLVFYTKTDIKGKLIEKIKQFYTKEHYTKKITTTYSSNGEYAVENEIFKSVTRYSKKGKVISKNNYVDAGEVVVGTEEVIEEVAVAVEAKLFPFKYKGKWGVVNTKNEEIIPPKYEYFVNPCNFNYLVFVNNQETLVYDLKTEEIIKSGMYKATFSVKSGNKKSVYSLFQENGNSYIQNWATLQQPRYQVNGLYDKAENVVLSDSVGKVTANFILLSSENKSKITPINGVTKITSEFKNLSKKEYNYIGWLDDEGLKNVGLCVIHNKNTATVYDENLKKVYSFKPSNSNIITLNEVKEIEKKLNKQNLIIESVGFGLGLKLEQPSFLLSEHIKLPKFFYKKGRRVYYKNPKGEEKEAKIKDFKGIYFLFFENNAIVVDESLSGEMFLYPRKYLK